VNLWFKSLKTQGPCAALRRRAGREEVFPPVIRAETGEKSLVPTQPGR
jgi:hypothetical protein